MILVPDLWYLTAAPVEFEEEHHGRAFDDHEITKNENLDNHPVV